MAWPKGKPRLSEEERSARETERSTRGMYDMTIPHRHGDGKTFGCGEFITSFRLLDPASDEKKKAVMTEHKKTCWSEKKRG